MSVSNEGEDILKDQIDRLFKVFPTNTIPEVKEKTKFWMVRSKKGLFYKDFINKGYIAVGWNYITQETNLNSDRLSDEIKRNHPKVKQATKAINKCKFIINDMKDNDIVVLPNKGMTEITIAVLGEYYEEKSKTVEEENSFDMKIEVDPNSVLYTDCPYIKRRKIFPLRTIKTGLINHHLYQTLRNYNGVDDIDEHANLILGLIYNAFFWDGKLHISLEVSQKEDISLSDISGLLYGSNRYFNAFSDKGMITAKVNVSSAGGVDFILSNGYQVIETYGPAAVLVFIGVILVGYVATKVDIPKLIKDTLCLPSYYRQERLNEEMKKLEIEIKKQDLISKTRENREQIYEELKVDELAVSLLSEIGEPLEINIDKVNDNALNVISNIQKKAE